MKGKKRDKKKQRSLVEPEPGMPQPHGQDTEKIRRGDPAATSLHIITWQLLVFHMQNYVMHSSVSAAMNGMFWSTIGGVSERCSGWIYMCDKFKHCLAGI